MSSKLLQLPALPLGSLGGGVRPVEACLALLEQPHAASFVALVVAWTAEQPFSEFNGRHEPLLHRLLAYGLPAARPEEAIMDTDRGQPMDREWLAERMVTAGADPWQKLKLRQGIRTLYVSAFNLAVGAGFPRLALSLLRHPGRPDGLSLGRDGLGHAFLDGHGPALPVWAFVCSQEGPEWARLRQGLVDTGLDTTFTTVLLDQGGGRWMRYGSNTCRVHIEALEQHVQQGWLTGTEREMRALRQVLADWQWDSVEDRGEGFVPAKPEDIQALLRLIERLEMQGHVNIAVSDSGRVPERVRL